jgi:hypothetical protein
MGNAHWLRLLLLIVLGAGLAGVGYLIQQKHTPRKRSPADLPTDVVTVLILLGGTVESLSPDASLLSQACLVGLVGWVGSWLARRWHGD